MKTTQPALRPYLEIIENECQSFTKNALIRLILSMARQMGSENRNDFMQNFCSCLLREYCRVRYNRHSAFRGEMRGIVSKSRVLCVMVEGV